MTLLAADALTQGYAELLDGSYDVVDRLVLNAYFPLGQSPGGFRTWWRQLHGGQDATLDDTHLMRIAGRFARRLRGWAAKHQIPVVHCTAGERKSDVAQQYLPADPSFRGIFVVLVNRAPAPVWEVVPCKNGGIHLQRKRPWVNHYSFHILDDEWGHLTIKMCGHPPFSAQVMLNGHEYVACQARQAGVVFTKDGNCFTELSDAQGLAECADALRSPTAVGRLGQVLERWIYTCACFGLSFDEQRATHFQYSYSVYQVEYSRNLLFTRGAVMDQVFQGLIDRSRAPLDFKTVKTLFGAKQRPRGRGRPPRLEAVVERPTYDLTVFKVHFGRRTVKLYTKGERVLRIEAIVHNTAELRCGKVLDRFPRIVDCLAELLERFLNVLRSIDAPFVAGTTLDELPLSGQLGPRRVGGIDLNRPRIRAVIEAVVALSAVPEPFTSARLATRVTEATRLPYTPRQAAYDLRKLRAKSLVTRVPRRLGYQASPEGLRTMAALLVLRDKVERPVLAGVLKPKRGRPVKKELSPLDERYRQLQRDMDLLFRDLGIAA
jgi:hypothetical protein